MAEEVIRGEGRTEGEWLDYCIGIQDNYVLLGEYEKRAAQGKMGIAYIGGRGNRPVLFATGVNLPEAWENSMINLWVNGMFIRTQYDQKNNKGLYIDPPSKDCTMFMTVEEPLSEPRLHRDFPGGLDTLEEYRQEVVDGIKDHWIRDPKNPADKRWEYTYHGRALRYEVPGIEFPINQFAEMAKGLAKSTITRRALMSSWKPWEDLGILDPACWQQTWARIFRQHPNKRFAFYSDENIGKPKLNPNHLFRSRAGYTAGFMNDWAFIEWYKKLTEGISVLRNEQVDLGSLLDVSWSFHIYGNEFKDFLGRFVKGIKDRHFLPESEYDNNARTWRSDFEVVQTIFAEARRQIPEKIRAQDEKYAKGEDLTKGSFQLFKEPK